MKIKLKIFFLIGFFISTHTFAQSQSILLTKDFDSFKIEKEASFWRDDSQQSTIEEVLKSNKPFKKIENANILTGNVKHRGWVKFVVNSAINQEILLEIQNPVLDSLKIYQVVDSQVIKKIEYFNKTTPHTQRNFRSRNFVHEFNLKANQKNTFYISHDVDYAISTLPIKIWQMNAFLNHQEVNSQFKNIFYGILILILISCLLVGFLLKIRLFVIFGINVLALILHFLKVEGVLYQTLSETFLSNHIYDLDLLILFSPFLVHILFVKGLTRIDEHRYSFMSKLYHIVVWFSVFYFIFTIFIPILVPIIPHSILNFIYKFAVLFFPISLIYFVFALFSSLQRTYFAKFYLVASALGLIVSLVVFLNNGYFSIHAELNYNFLRIGVLAVMFMLFLGLLFQVRENFNNQVESRLMPELKVEIIGNEKLLIREQKELLITGNQVLTKREMEILKAFANGFTHQEIAEAMFISPHTAKTHLKNIYQKLGINSKVEAVRWVMEHQDL